jgi:uncharacterized membrane protein YfcA
MPTIAYLLLIGLFAGTLSGLFGIGAGVVITPALLWLTSSTQTHAQGVAYAVMVPMAILGTWRYQSQPGMSLDWALVLPLGAACLAGVWLGSHLAFLADETVLRRAFGAYLLLAGGQLLLGSR